MSKTKIIATEILNNSVTKSDINTSVSGLALITKLILGTGLTTSSTGIDAGTGDVTVNSATVGVTSPVTSVFGRTGLIIKQQNDYNFTDLAGSLAATQTPGFAGDFSTSNGSVSTTLATVNSNVGTFGSFTVNAKGLITAASLNYSLITPLLNSTALTGYTDNSLYYGLATTANGFPQNGTLTGSRIGTVGSQRIANQSNVVQSGQFNRSWDSTNLLWRNWFYSNENTDYSKGSLAFGCTRNLYSANYYQLLSGTDGMVVTASAASATTTGSLWSSVSIANGGTGAVTAPAALVNLGIAPINSPAFTGLPIVTSPGAGNISQSVCSTGFFQHSTNGYWSTTLPTSGNVTLTSLQYLASVIVLKGAITGAVTVTFPNTGTYNVINTSTGGFTVTLKTAAGTGVNIAQGSFTKAIVADGTNIQPANTDFTGLSNAVVGGTTRQMQWNNAGVIAGMALLESSAQGNLVGIDNGVDPTTPTTGATYYSKKTGGKTLWYQKDTDGTVMSHQPSISTNRVSYWAHTGTSALLTAPSVTSFGFNMLTVGTPVSQNTMLDFANQNKKVLINSAAVAGSSAEIYNSAVQWNVGSIGPQNTKLGGFYCVIRCYTKDAVAGATFIGLTSNTSAIMNSSLTTIGNTSAMVGLFCNAGDTNFSIGTSDGGLNATGGNGFGFIQAALTNAMPCSTLATNQDYDLLDVRFYSPSGSATIFYYFKWDSTNNNTLPATVTNTGFLTTANAVSVPTGNLLLAPRIWRNNGTSATAVGIDIISVYIETAY